MADTQDLLCYHGRRSVDELLGALAAENVEVAMIHKQLSLLHLDRFISALTSADRIHHQVTRSDAADAG